MIQCPFCKYSLAGLPDAHQCPECGFVYDEHCKVLHIHARLRSVLMAVGVTLGLPATVVGLMWLLMGGWFLVYLYLFWWGLLVFVPICGYFIVAAILSHKYVAAIVRADGVSMRRRNGEVETTPWSSIKTADYVNGTCVIRDKNDEVVRRIKAREVGGRWLSKLCVRWIRECRRIYRADMMQ